ncbi:hypothetical protein [Pseudomonas koreensis]|nr:hypothetical protein [Pseudomonas koreensis]
MNAVWTAPDEVEITIGSLDGLNQCQPAYELWTVRREACQR